MTTPAAAPSRSRPLPPAPSRLPLADAGMLLVCCIWGANFSVMKGAFSYLPPLGFTAVRFSIASLLLYLLLRWRNGAVAMPRGLGWRMVWLGLLGNTAYQVAFTLSLLWGTATNSALIVSTIPAMVTVLAGVFRIEPVTPRMWAGTAIATLGVVLVIAAGGVDLTAGSLKGDACALAATLCWAVYTLGLRGIPATVSPLETTALTTFTGTPGLIALGLVDVFAVDWLRVPAGAWGALAYSSVLSLILAYGIWNASVRKVGSSRTAIYMCLTPLVAALVAWATLGEKLVALQGAGAVFIVTGVLMTRKA